MARRQIPKTRMITCDDCGTKGGLGMSIFQVSERLGGGRICLPCRTGRAIDKVKAELEE